MSSSGRREEYECNFFSVFGNVQLRRYLLDFVPGVPYGEFRNPDHAARAGHLEMFEDPDSPLCFDQITKTTLMIAVREGHLGVVQWFSKNHPGLFTTDAMDIAADHGHLDIVKWLHHNRSEGCTTHAMNLAAAGNHLKVIQWLHCNRSEGCTTNAMDFAVGSDFLDTAKWLNEYRAEGCSYRAMYVAIDRNKLRTVQWLCENARPSWKYELATRLATTRGRHEIAQYLRQFCVQDLEQTA